MQDIQKLLPFIRPYWRRAVVALILLTSLVFMDLSIPRLIQRIIDQGINQHNQQLVIQTSIIMVSISILSTVVAIANSNLSVQVGESIARDLRDALFTKIQSFSYSNLDAQQTGQLMVRLTSDTVAVQRIAQISLRIGTRAPLLIIGSMILMINTDRNLALTMLPLLFVTSIIIYVFVIKMEPWFRSVQQKLDSLNTVLQENIAGARLVKSFVRPDYEQKRFDVANEAFTDHSIRVMQIMSSMGPILTQCINIGMVIVIWAGGIQSINAKLTIGQIVAFTNYLMTTMGPLTMMTMLSNTWASGMASAHRVNEILDTVPDVQDDPQAIELPEKIPGKITFENVSFYYGKHETDPVFENVSFTIEPGKTVAILGATGAGKSTLVNLIPRFYDVISGRILLDGVDIRRIKQDSLLKHIGIVPQESVLFSGTVEDNISYGNPSAEEEQILAISRIAQADGFIENLSKGYATHVEERGANLSGGQKQRIAIARALLTQPQILILDDSTSSVDVETETKIQDALASGSNRQTFLIVAQRISTVLKADKIIVIDNGHVVAEGTHSDLLKSSQIYREIYESQLGNGLQFSKTLHLTETESLK